MKNLSQRTKILLAIAGGMYVIAAIVLVIFWSSLEGLFGAPASIAPVKGTPDNATEGLFGTNVNIASVKVTPDNATMDHPGLQIQLTSNYNDCTWSVSDSKVLVIRSSTGYTATVEGVGPGTTAVTATCSPGKDLFNVMGGSMVTVMPSP